ncbi:TPA: hypothetical protein QDC20_006142 [Burkholderia aenigmatica]|uniref:hypothetical protein n=1 Tax=Burkholderia TaxID=32008 RepID=UPI001582B365|nr:MULTISPECIES: hypothetical protein [Burkholderia]MDN7517271.1 hypothetical protein [Burkholderia sp. AU45251]HDR9484720.1 hypothetical protein [Burkholderia aenigmatica]HDR9516267.1 hypothetical protein [Burkholderia aenigmatica]HDR9520563.1 hypothetical protein [Burkholderia aenigmatica]HDR9593327.1 hypothetical protein [Burkholderia aenigmatica]
MLFLLGSGRRSVSARAADSSIQAIQWFRSGPRDRCGGDRVAKGEKKPPGSPAVFSGISVALYAPSTLSIRQRSEIPKKVKVKLGGHDGDSVRQKS